MGSGLWALSQELLNELNLNPLPHALVALSGDFMTLSFSFPSCKMRGIPLLEFVGSIGSNGAFEECSLVPGTWVLADQWHKHGQVSKNEHLYHNSLSARVFLGGSGPWHQWRAVWQCNPGLFLFVPGPPFTCSVLVNLLPSLFVLMGDCHPCDTAKACWVERNKAVTVSLYGLLTFLNKPKLH